MTCVYSAALEILFLRNETNSTIASHTDIGATQSQRKKRSFILSSCCEEIFYVDYEFALTWVISHV